MKWPDDNKITVITLAIDCEPYPDEIEAVTMLGSDSKLEWNRDETGLTVALPAKKPLEFADLLKVVR